jgi:hypothetical protein
MSLIGLVIASALAAGRVEAGAAGGGLTGREIYVQQCARCHGRSGEGVKGKHDDPLQGDRSLEKLARYIERNMPEDAPHKCVGEDATAVAKYIYDAFYSRDARLRNHPPRVELLRLSNRQYVNTVADLLKHFTGTDGALKADRGLQAAYCASRDFNADKKVIERLDRQVDFDFIESSDHEKLRGTNGFSVQWRGSLSADETGDYEFILRTPNGARLWLNDEVEPVIDAWVASGEVREHKATLRLLGGRSYPLRLDLFRYKEKAAALSLEWKPPRGPQGLIPARNLSPSGASPTLVITTAFPPDDSSLGYERGMGVSKAWDEATTSAAIEVANHVAKDLDQLSGSKQDDTNRVAKVEAFCREFVATAWRRPLTEAEGRAVVAAGFKKLKSTVHSPQSTVQGAKSEVRGAKGEGKPRLVGSEKEGRGIEDAVKRVVLLALKSPRFLYVGLENGTEFEIAERLSFGLWDSLPDRELWKAASEGRLRTREQVTRQARRMLGDPRARAKMQAFFHHWLQMDRIENVSKDEKIFPGFTPAIIADLRTSLDLFLADTLWSETADYRALLQADYLFLNNRLAEFYGVSTNATDDFAKVKLNPEQRSGVLTHPYLLAAFSYQKFTSPIHRGVFLTRNIVGRALKPPPMAMTFKDADFAPNLTMREKVAQLTRPQACQTCHSVINPLGFSLEQYDAVGRFRTSDHDQPINSVSDYATDDGQTVHLAGARDVASFALGSEQALNGFIEQLFHHVVKQPALAYGADTLDRLRQSFVASEFNLQKLLVDIATVSALRGSEKAPTPKVASAQPGS